MNTISQYGLWVCWCIDLCVKAGEAENPEVISGFPGILQIPYRGEKENHRANSNRFITQSCPGNLPRNDRRG